MNWHYLIWIIPIVMVGIIIMAAIKKGIRSTTTPRVTAPPPPSSGHGAAGTATTTSTTTHGVATTNSSRGWFLMLVQGFGAFLIFVAVILVLWGIWGLYWWINSPSDTLAATSKTGGREKETLSMPAGCKKLTGDIWECQTPVEFNASMVDLDFTSVQPLDIYYGGVTAHYIPGKVTKWPAHKILGTPRVFTKPANAKEEVTFRINQ